MANWEDDVTTSDIHQYFYEIREHVKTAIGDFQLLCDIFTERELRAIFGTKEQGTQSEDMYPITQLLSSLLPTILPERILREAIASTNQAIKSTRIDLSYAKDKDRIKTERRQKEVK